MKIYYIGHWSKQEPLVWFRKAFASLGEYIEDNWAEASEKYGTAAYNAHILNRANHFQPDVVFCHIMTEGILYHSTIKSLQAFTINWTGDVRHPLPRFYTDSGKHFNLTLFTNLTDVKEARRHKITADYWQVFADASVYKPHGPQNKKWDIAFMGNNYAGTFPLGPLRLRLATELRKAFGESFGLFGTGYKDEQAVSTMYNHAECAAIYRGCKIAINLSHYNYGRYSSDRIFRIMNTGAFCLTHHYKDIEEDFIPGVHLDTWHTIPELEEKTRYYLSHDKQRQKIADAGLRHIQKNHSADKRMKELKVLIKQYSV